MPSATAGGYGALRTSSRRFRLRDRSRFSLRWIDNWHPVRPDEVSRAMSTYLGQAALDQLSAAQAVIDDHLVSCLACSSSRPCVERRDAEATFLRYGGLPRRKPGLTRSATTPGFGWLNQVRSQESYKD